jgi:hypothetical protein
LVASESDAARNAPSPGTDSAHSDAPSRNVDLQQLDRVLENTLAQLNKTKGTVPPELIQVAQRHPGAALTLPVVQDLVYSVLFPDWQELAGGQAEFQALCAQIADTLFEDPVAHARLRNMWTGLAGKTS